MEKTKKKSKIKVILVIAFLIVFVLYSYMSYRSNYLQTLEIGEEYLSVFNQNYEYQYKLFTFNFIVIFIIMIITNIIIKRGLKVFFKEENKEIPKLPNKSLAFIFAIIISAIVTVVFKDKLMLFLNNAWFGINDPVFGLDIGFYLFQKPFIELTIYYIIALLIFLTMYTATYYITVFNIYLQGIDKQTLLRSKFIKILKINAFLIVLAIASLVFLSTYNVMLNEFISLKDELSTKIIGAGITDISLKVWGYRILSIVMIISSIFIIKYIFNRKSIKQLLIAVGIVPAYLVVLFIIMILFNVIFVNTNKFDKEKGYIYNNINYTQEAFNIKINEKEITSSEGITNIDLDENSDVVENINIVNDASVLKSLNLLYTNSGYYSYRIAKLQMYKVNDKDTLVYVSPREIDSSIDSSRHNKTYEYTHGFGSAIAYASRVDETGNIEYLEKDFTSSNNGIYVVEPRIYYGLQTNNSVIINENSKEEFDYPVTTTKQEKNSYNGKSGININFIDKLILSIMNKNINIAFTKTSENSKTLINRNVIERAKKIMPYLQYDEEPYLIVSDEGRQIWVLDAYTISNEYPYSQRIKTKVNNSKKELNYIRNSVKVLVDAYNGNVEFYVTDETDPIAVAYSHAYEGLFKNGNEISTSISSHFTYPRYLYNVQSEVIKIYHNVSEDVLYRGNDIWDVPSYSTTLKSTAKEDIEPYSTMVKYNGENKVGMMLPYTVYGKQNITGYLIGTTDSNGKNVLRLYKYSSGTNILGPEQLDKEIEQDETIAKEIESINVTGTKITKSIIIVPINNSLLYVEPIYQQQLNEKNSVALLKKVVVASGSKVAIGDNVSEAISNLLSQSAVNIEVDSEDVLENIINEIIKTNKDLIDSSKIQNFELMGKDINKLQELIQELEEEKSIADKNNKKAEVEEKELTNILNKINE